MNFIDFALDLFPDLTIQDAESASLSRNPDVPPDVLELLQYVSCETGVPVDWLAKSARLVLDGLAGCRCLWYLHGAEGKIEEEPNNYPPIHEQSFRDALKKEAHRREKKARLRDGLDHFTEITPEWDAGHANICEYLTANDYNNGVPTKVSQEKLGKLIKKLEGLTDRQRTDLFSAQEKRVLPIWDWEVSAHPFDVLTMSFRRPWTSCMRPPDPEGRTSEARAPGVAHKGPLTDMAAGSAVLFFYRPGADKPCGRRILRPVLDQIGNIYVADGATTYGSGVEVIKSDELETMLAEATGVQVPIYPHEFCAAGSQGHALTRYIYSDVDREHCDQSEHEYQASYENLYNASWPNSALEPGDLYNRAEGLKELVGYVKEKDIRDIAVHLADGWADMNYDGVIGLISLAEDNGSNIPTTDDLTGAENEMGRELTDYERRSLSTMMSERFMELVEEYLARAEIAVLVLYGAEDGDGWEEQTLQQKVYAVEEELDHIKGDSQYNKIPVDFESSYQRFPDEVLEEIKDAGIDPQAMILYPDGDFDNGRVVKHAENLGFSVEEVTVLSGHTFNWGNW